MQNLEVAKQWFVRQRIDNAITLLTEPYAHPMIRCNIWHICGRDRDLLIDTGLGIVSLRIAAADLFEKPLIAVATHAHFDHVGGISEFEPRVIHKLEADWLAEALDSMALTRDQLGPDFIKMAESAGYSFDDELLVTASPYAGFAPEAHVLKPATGAVLIGEGDVIDLGDRHFEVLHLPGHSPGSIGLYEKATQTLFSGDAIYDGPLLADIPGANLDDYIATMRRLLELPVRVAHAGHEKSFGQDRLREIAKQYLETWGE